MNIKDIQKKYKEKHTFIRKLDIQEQLKLLDGSLEEFDRYINSNCLCYKAQMKLFDIDLKYLDKYIIDEYDLCPEAQLKLFTIDLKYLDKYIEKNRFSNELQMKLFTVNLKYLGKYIEKHWLSPEAENKLEELSKLEDKNEKIQEIAKEKDIELSR